MAISYVKTKPAQPVQPAARESLNRAQLRHWLTQYHALDVQIDIAQVSNGDPLRKERVNVRDLYSRRAAAAARMAHYADLVLHEL